MGGGPRANEGLVASGHAFLYRSGSKKMKNVSKIEELGGGRMKLTYCGYAAPLYLEALRLKR